MTAPSVTITVVEGITFVETPYLREFVAELKAQIPGYARRWNNLDKLWVITGISPRATVIRLCREYFAGLEFKGNGWTAPKQEAPSSVDWAAAMFATTPARLHEPIYRALVKVLHPDIGGDTEQTKTLTEAYAKRVAA